MKQVVRQISLGIFVLAIFLAKAATSAAPQKSAMGVMSGSNSSFELDFSNR